MATADRNRLDGRDVAVRLVATLRVIRMEIRGRPRLALRLAPPAGPDAARLWPEALREAGFARHRAVAAALLGLSNEAARAHTVI